MTVGELIEELLKEKQDILVTDLIGFTPTRLYYENDEVYGERVVID